MVRRTPAPTREPSPADRAETIAGTPDPSLAERDAALRRLQAALRTCRACEAAGYLPRANPIAGDQGVRRLFLLGQAPGERSDRDGIPFAGSSGRVLETWLTRAGFAPGALRRAVYLSAVTRCDPGRGASGAGDRPPSRPERALCAHWWRTELALIRPRVILLAGRLAIEEYFPPAPLDALVGTWGQEGDALLLPLPHPSGVSRWLNAPAHRALLERALARLSDWREQYGLEEPPQA
jgi:uracil-DNA glycosylase family 4